mmetsp:Transcript_9781/g.25671  ORF Transcript_9781/g.25671 Transcript_9781/m.25671 type:complete len:581 (+) Transcript_9781:1950-3692(+)
MQRSAEQPHTRDVHQYQHNMAHGAPERRADCEPQAAKHRPSQRTARVLRAITAEIRGRANDGAVEVEEVRADYKARRERERDFQCDSPSEQPRLEHLVRQSPERGQHGQDRRKYSRPPTPFCIRHIKRPRHRELLAHVRLGEFKQERRTKVEGILVLFVVLVLHRVGSFLRSLASPALAYQQIRRKGMHEEQARCRVGASAREFGFGHSTLCNAVGSAVLTQREQLLRHVVAITQCRAHGTAQRPTPLVASFDPFVPGSLATEALPFAATPGHDLLREIRAREVPQQLRSPCRYFRQLFVGSLADDVCRHAAPTCVRSDGELGEEATSLDGLLGRQESLVAVHLQHDLLDAAPLCQPVCCQDGVPRQVTDTITGLAELLQKGGHSRTRHGAPCFPSAVREEGLTRLSDDLGAAVGDCFESRGGRGHSTRAVAAWYVHKVYQDGARRPKDRHGRVLHARCQQGTAAIGEKLHHEEARQTNEEHFCVLGQRRQACNDGKERTLQYHCNREPRVPRNDRWPNKPMGQQRVDDRHDSANEPLETEHASLLQRSAATEYRQHRRARQKWLHAGTEKVAQGRHDRQ